MSEQQASYDTGVAQPTRGPWEAITIEKEGTFVDVKGEDSEVARMSVPGEEGKVNARLIAAAGTAASGLSEEYDPVEVLRHLPEIVDGLEAYVGRLALHGNATSREEKAIDALNNACKYT